jgi:hypothetical protein
MSDIASTSPHHPYTQHIFVSRCVGQHQRRSPPSVNHLIHGLFMLKEMEINNSQLHLTVLSQEQTHK